MTGRIVLLGATGYTGGLVLDSLRRRGVEPVLAGRDRDALHALAQRSGRLDYALVDVTDAERIAAVVGRGDVLITTVGPFERFGHAVARAAADIGAHYIDSTGEVGFVRDLHRDLNDRARATGAVMLPAFGYDYVPGILAGTLAAHWAGDRARSIDIGYFATGPLWRGLSQGTRTTMRDAVTLPIVSWRDRRITEARTASKVRAFTVRGRRRSAFLVSGTEVLYLPSAFPALDNVTVYNGWFPALSRLISIQTTIAAATVRIPGGRALVDLLSRPMIGPAGGPDTAERARTRTHVVAVASDKTGVLAEVHLEGPSIYTLTGELIAWGAAQLLTGPRLTTGVVGPVEAFGREALLQGCAEIGLNAI
ncbi:saccharopine dehydrogenase family protein [Nocardia sp. NPDC004711]